VGTTCPEYGESAVKRKPGQKPGFLFHTCQPESLAIHPVALTGGVIVTMVIGHTHRLADLVTMVHRVMRRSGVMVVGVGSQGRHERGGHDEKAENPRTLVAGASGVDGNFAFLFQWAGAQRRRSGRSSQYIRKNCHDGIQQR
jgi:hypothetical protein